MMYGYDTIKQLAKEQGCKVTDVIALAPQNDPFYMGTPGDIEKAGWFAELWHRYGFGYGVHIRRVHYRIISQEVPVLMPNGKPYENTEACWDFLGMASKTARYLKLVDPGAFVDRRNPEPSIYRYVLESVPAIDVESSAWGAADFPDFPVLPSYEITGFEGEQHYHVELWCEKSTMNDVLIPLCRQYRANLVTGVGEMSITAVMELTNSRMDGKPVRILYVSDFDPAGQSMPCAVARKIEYFLQERSSHVDVKLFPVVMTAEQVKAYRLPRTPIKESERRATRFEDRYGSGAVELDALEALHPGELRQILKAEIERYYDASLDDRVFAARSRLAGELEDIQDEVISSYQDQIAALQLEHQTLRAEFEARMVDYGQKVQSLWHAISLDLVANTPAIDEDHIPQARGANEKDDALFDSQRDYISQLSAYKTWQGKTVGEVVR